MIASVALPVKFDDWRGLIENPSAALKHEVVVSRDVSRQVIVSWRIQSFERNLMPLPPGQSSFNVGVLPEMWRGFRESFEQWPEPTFSALAEIMTRTQLPASS